MYNVVDLKVTLLKDIREHKMNISLETNAQNLITTRVNKKPLKTHAWALQ